MNFKIDKGITNLEIFRSFLYYAINFEKISKTVLNTMADEAIENFLLA